MAKKTSRSADEPTTKEERPVRRAALPLPGKAKVHQFPGHEEDTASQRKPKPPFPARHQEKPGLESRIQPRPRYSAPAYRPAGKRLHRAASIDPLVKL